MNQRLIVAALALLAVLATAVWLLRGTPSPSSPTPEPAASSPAPTQGAPVPRSPRVTSPPAADPSVPGAPPVRGSPGEPEVLAIPAPTAAPDQDAELLPEDRPIFPLDEDGIRDAVADRQLDLQACYETALASHPTLEGDMVLGFELVPADDGSVFVEDVDVDVPMERDGDNVAKMFLEGCILTVFEELRFDAGPDAQPTTVNYPVVFRTE